MRVMFHLFLGKPRQVASVLLPPHSSEEPALSSRDIMHLFKQAQATAGWLSVCYIFLLLSDLHDDR